MSTPYARAKYQTVAATAASVDLSGKAKEVILSSTTDCWVNFNGTAVASQCFYLPKDAPTRVDISRKESISVIQDSAGGTISVLELADSLLIDTTSDFFKSDSMLLRTDVADTYFGDASMLRVVAATATGDASIATRYSATATGDSSLLRTTSDTVTGDCTLVTP